MAANFAPYTPPPDEAASSSLFAIDSPPPSSPSLPSAPLPGRVLGSRGSPGGGGEGGYDWDASHAAYASGNGNGSGARWTPARLCSAAYALPPFSSGLVLVLSHEPLPRFHALQSLLLSVPFISLLLVLRAVGLWWLPVVALFAGVGWCWVAGANAAKASSTQARVPYLPFFGAWAERLGEL